MSNKLTFEEAIYGCEKDIKLEVNDKVILLRIDDKFIILDKVVSI